MQLIQPQPVEVLIVLQLNLMKIKVISQGTALGGAVAILDGKNTGYIPTVDFNNAALTNNSVESAGNFSTGAKGGAIYAGVLSFSKY